MGKYNFEFDPKKQNDSLAIICEKIESNSTVLEFGPANGRLTRYLTENKQCIIDVVEFDLISGTDASKYARTSCLGKIYGDIDKKNWFEKLKDNKYDYIVFADVLEHLRNPKEALLKCRRLLNKGGKLLISIPNVAHNSILLNLFNEKFTYTETGLLDNTHIHLFAYYSAIEMFRETGYDVDDFTTTISEVGTNEINTSYDDVNPEIANILKNREKSYGLAYQFVFELSLNNTVGINYNVVSKQETRHKFQYYVLEENDENFTEDKSNVMEVVEGNNTININLESYGKIKAIRIDPMEGAGKVEVKKINCIIDAEKINLLPSNSNGCEYGQNKYFFNHSDPQIIIAINAHKIKELILYINIEELDEDDCSMFLNNELLNITNELQKEYAHEKETNDKIQDELNKIINSRSWKITKPLRKIALFFK